MAKPKAPPKRAPKPAPEAAPEAAAPSAPAPVMMETIIVTADRKRPLRAALARALRALAVLIDGVPGRS